MDGNIVGAVVLGIVVAVVAIAVVIWLLSVLYHRSTKELSFVRTGMGGQKVVINGGAIVLPVIHEVTPVSMNVQRLSVARGRDNAVITKDRMRVDIDADFFLRVAPTRDAVAAAAATLGRRTLEPERLTELLEGKFVGALRSVAAEMTIDEMHERRADYVAAVTERAAEALARNGLELESVAITDLEQTELDYFNPANRFDAEGLTRLVEAIEERRKARNDIEQSALVAIRARNLAAEKEQLAIERESAVARLDQEREIAASRAQQRAEIARTDAAREAEASQARIAAEEETSAREIARRRALEEAEIAAREETESRRIAQEQALELARIGRERAVRAETIAEREATEAAEIAAQQTLEAARIGSDEAVRAARIATEQAVEAKEIDRARALEAARIAQAEAVETARVAQELAVERARIDREKLLRSLRIEERQATEEAEIAAREGVERARLATDRALEEARIQFERDIRRLELERAQLVELAEIDKEIAVLHKQEEAHAARANAEEARARATVAEEAVTTKRETEVAQRIAAVDQMIAEKDAAIARTAAAAERVRAEVAAEGERLRNEADNLLSEEARAGRLRERMLDRLEGIVRESVRPMEKIEGIKIVQMQGFGPAAGPVSRSPTDEVIESALRFRAQAPLIDEMMKEIGVENAGVARMGDIFRSARDAASLAKDTGSGAGTGVKKKD